MAAPGNTTSLYCRAVIINWILESWPNWKHDLAYCSICNICYILILNFNSKWQLIIIPALNKLIITRTIKVSCLSRFLLLLLPAWQILMRPNPDTRIRPSVNFCTRTQKWLRSYFVPRYCASGFEHISVPWLKTGRIKVCTVTPPIRKSDCTRMAKTRAIPVLPPGLKSG